MKRGCRNIGILVLSLAGWGAPLVAQQQPQPSAVQSARMVAPAESKTGDSSQSSSPSLQPHHPTYEIARQDVLVLTFPLSPELNQTVTVQPDGYINLQGAKSIYVQGLTVPKVETLLKVTYAPILRDPVINVDLKDFQKPLFTVTGQVGKPGRYELRSDINVAEAIAVAGGLTPTSKPQVWLFHKDPNREGFIVEKIDLKRMFDGKQLKDNASIGPGDIILVPESALTIFKKYVPYNVGASLFNPF